MTVLANKLLANETLLKMVNCVVMKWNEYEIILLTVTIVFPLNIESRMVICKGFIADIKFESISVLEVTRTALKLI